MENRTLSIGVDPAATTISQYAGGASPSGEFTTLHNSFDRGGSKPQPQYFQMSIPIDEHTPQRKMRINNDSYV